jgi:hypothetical protein
MIPVSVEVKENVKPNLPILPRPCHLSLVICPSGGALLFAGPQRYVVVVAGRGEHATEGKRQRTNDK